MPVSKDTRLPKIQIVIPAQAGMTRILTSGYEMIH